MALAQAFFKDQLFDHSSTGRASLGWQRLRFSRELKTFSLCLEAVESVLRNIGDRQPTSPNGSLFQLHERGVSGCPDNPTVIERRECQAAATATGVLPS